MISCYVEVVSRKLKHDYRRKRLHGSAKDSGSIPDGSTNGEYPNGEESGWKPDGLQSLASSNLVLSV